MKRVFGFIKSSRFWYIVVVVIFYGLYIAGQLNDNDVTGISFNLIARIACVVLLPLGTYIAIRFAHDNKRWVGNAFVFVEFVAIQSLALFLADNYQDELSNIWGIILMSWLLLCFWSTGVYAIIQACLPIKKAK